MAAKKAKTSKRTSAPKRAKTAAPRRVEAVPARYGTATASLVVSPAKKALAFYEKAFGAKVFDAMESPDGLVLHGEMQIGDSIIMLADEQPAVPGMPANHKTPKSVGAVTGSVMLYVENVDAFFKRAVKAGATPIAPPTDMFWGDRFAQVDDPFGHSWSMATHVRDVTAKEMGEAMAKMSPPA